MHQIITASSRYFALTVAMLLLVGCTKSCTRTSSSDWNVNGRRTSTRTHDGITRKLETTADIAIHDGHVTKFPKAALVKIQETGGSEQRQAELRENAGKLELWINDSGEFRAGSVDEDAWLERFLGDFSTK